jgi:predicted nucleotidyltransferase component of viral defense system
LKDYSLDSFQLKYENAYGGEDSIKVEINYIAGRVPIDPFDMRVPYDLFELHPSPIQLLSINEVYASKVEALMKRHAARDLFDVYQLAKYKLLQISDLRPRVLFSCCVEMPHDFRNELNQNPAAPITDEQIENQLRPYLREADKFDLNEAKQTVDVFCRELFTLAPTQRNFLDNLFDKRIYCPELLFTDRNHLREHPGIKWRLQQLSRN